MKGNALRHGFLLVTAGTFLLPSLIFAQKGLSHVRVVRLSYVAGTVAVKRPAATEWAKAMVNTPIQEGFEISTAAQSYAEVEFENGSTTRIGELSKISFDQLAMDEHGDKLNRVTFEQGYATFHLLPAHHDVYSVTVGESTLSPAGKTEFRTDIEHGQARLEVFSGAVDVATSADAKPVKVSKDKVLDFNPGDTQIAANVKQGIVKDSWDKWTSARDTQSQLSLNDQAVQAPGSTAYGWSDLDAYGEWGYFPGFGYGWSPFAAAGWSPYSMGMWSWYPGMGYTWISGEPWGWMPYHYGNWNFSSGFGWFWMPGSFDSFSPAMVSWYSGPGWIGWAPLGMYGAGGSIITAVPGGVIQNGRAITPQNVNHEPLGAGTRIRNMPFEPGAGAMLSGAALTAGAGSSFGVRNAAMHGMAPNSILMGGDSGREESLLTGHASHQPLRARMGTTLGGRYAVGGAMGEFHGDAFAGTHGPNGEHGPEFGRNGGPGGPAFMPHGQQLSLSSHGEVSPRGEAGAGGPRMSEGGMSHSSSAPVSAPSSSAGAAHGGGGSSAGGSAGGGRH